jgi:tripartite-type tricarboxylate transporter receptor subunit TctC
MRVAHVKMDERARTQGFRLDARGPVQFAAFLKDEVEHWSPVIQAAGITAP